MNLIISIKDFILSITKKKKEKKIIIINKNDPQRVIV